MSWHILCQDTPLTFSDLVCELPGKKIAVLSHLHFHDKGMSATVPDLDCLGCGAGVKWPVPVALKERTFNLSRLQVQQKGGDEGLRTNRDA